MHMCILGDIVVKSCKGGARERAKERRDCACMRVRKRERMHASVRVVMHTMHF